MGQVARRNKPIRSGSLQGAAVRSNVRFLGIELDLVEAGAVRMRMRRDMRGAAPYMRLHGAVASR